MPCFDRENETSELWRRFDGGQNLAYPVITHTHYM